MKPLCLLGVLLASSAFAAGDEPAAGEADQVQAKERAAALKADVKTFRLDLNYNGEQGKPFYRLTVSVPPIDQLASNPFERIVQVSDNEALAVIDHLATDGFLDQAVDMRTKIKIPAPSMPGYTMKVVAGELSLYEDLGWGLSMIHRLDAIRGALPAKSQEDMDLLLGRMSGWRARWEAERPPLKAQLGRDDSRVQFSAEDGANVIDITSKFGIDKATIRRESPQWPMSILLRLHLSGLESLRLDNGAFVTEWTVSSGGENTSNVGLEKGLEATQLDSSSPYYAAVRIVGGGKIPLKAGYFELQLPAKLFEKNPEEITLRWVDFFRD